VATLLAGPHPFAHRILIVFDREDDRSRIARALRRLGYGVVESRHGGDALVRSIRSPRIHLVIGDGTMRGLDVGELIRDIDASHPGVKALIVDGPTNPRRLTWQVREMLRETAA
jgi:CheY-like chemotaxis protein